MLNVQGSPYNRDPRVAETWNIRTPIILNDVTMREGEQAADVNFNLEQKLALARKLDEVGVPQVQGGYPGRSEIDKRFIQTLKKSGEFRFQVEAVVQIFTDDWKQQIDAAIESGADVVGLMHPSSDIRLEYQKMTRSDMLRRCLDGIRYAVDRCPVVRFSTTDSTRTDLEFLKEVYAAAIDAGAKRILVADTAGAVSPAGMKLLVGELVNTFDVPVQVHLHNDFGLGLANTLAAIEAGAQIIDVSINGLGERAGNASLDEVAVALKVFYGIDTGVDTSKLYGLARFMEELSGVPIPRNKPLVGELAFSHKLDAHVKGVMYNSFLYETIDPALVGNRRRIPIGKYSGPFVIRTALERLGRTATDEEVARIVAKVESTAIELRRALSDEEFLAIVSEVQQAS